MPKSRPTRPVQRFPPEHCSWPPPAGGEDPLRIGVQQGPRADGSRDNEQAEDLVAPEEPLLAGAALVFGNLLLVRLDAGLDHVKFQATYNDRGISVIPSCNEFGRSSGVDSLLLVHAASVAAATGINAAHSSSGFVPL